MNYTNLNKLWYDAIFNINLCGHKLDSRDGYCKEILGFQTTLTHPLHNILFVPGRKFSLAYACAEMLWYLSGTGNIEMIQAYAPQYEKFAEDGIAYGAYGARWAYNPGFTKERRQVIRNSTSAPNSENHNNTKMDSVRDQLSALVHLLKTNPNTRQAIMVMWDSGDLIHAIAKDHKDLPCTLSLIFYVRDNRLHLVVTMRSSDAWLGLPYDIFCFTTLQRIVAAELGLELGAYIHQAGSEHIYERNQEKVDEILQSDEEIISLYPYPLYWDYKRQNYGLQHNIEQALLMEKEIRKPAQLGAVYGMTKACLKNHLEKNRKEWEKIDPLFKDLALGCATKWAHIPNDWFDNPLYADCQRYTEKLNEKE